MSESIPEVARLAAAVWLMSTGHVGAGVAIYALSKVPELFIHMMSHGIAKQALDKMEADKLAGVGATLQFIPGVVLGGRSKAN